MSKVAVVCPVWKETRYLYPVLQQMTICPGPKLLLWQDKPLYWLSDKPCPSGFASKVDKLASQFPTVEIIKMEHAPRDNEEAPFGGFASLARVAFELLKMRGVEVAIWMDSDWLFTLREISLLYRTIIDHPYAMYWGTHARHYWRSWDQTMDTGDITVAFPIHQPDLWRSYSESEINRLDLMCYHPAYALSDEEMHDKIHSWGHAPLFKERGFYEKEWLANDDSQVKPKPSDVKPPEEILIRIAEGWKFCAEAGA